MIDHLLVLPRLRIQNANIISSPMTWGFPAMSAFVGMMQALERKLTDAIALEFLQIGVVCHHIEPQVTEGNFVKGFRLTRNPVDKSGKTAAIVEEGRAHLEISLLLEVLPATGQVLSSHEKRQTLACQLYEMVLGMRIAGGSVMPSTSPKARRYQPELISFSRDVARQWRRLKYRLLPGFSLVLRDDLLKKHTAFLKTQDSSTTVFDAWLDLSRINYVCHAHQHVNKEGTTVEQVEWHIRRPHPGWLVPIPVGFGAISKLYSPGEVANARDASVPFQFVESLYSIGEWVSPHRIDEPDALLWFVDSDGPEQGLYRLDNIYADTLVNH